MPQMREDWTHPQVFSHGPPQGTHRKTGDRQNLPNSNFSQCLPGFLFWGTNDTLSSLVCCGDYYLGE